MQKPKIINAGIGKFSDHKLHASISNKTFSPNQKDNRIIELQLQLKQAFSTIGVLKQENNKLLQKLAYYERKDEDFKSLHQELAFRKDQQKSMQDHLDNYKLINHKLRQKIIYYQNNKTQSMEFKKQSHFSTQEKSQSQMSIDQRRSRKKQKGLYLENSSVELSQKSAFSNGKENHQMTPKSRMNIDLQKFSKLEADHLLKIKQRRKVFL